MSEHARLFSFQELLHRSSALASALRRAITSLEVGASSSSPVARALE